MRRLLYFLVLATLLATATAASAGRSPYVERVFQQGQAQLQSGDFEAAVRQFKRCLFMVEGDDDETFRMTLLVALAYERLGNLPAAIEYYDRFVSLTSRAYPSVELFWDDRRSEAEYSREALEKRARRELSRIVVETTPPGADVLVDGRQAGADGDAVTPYEVYVGAGRHTITVRSKGHGTVTRRINAIAGAIHELRVDLAPTARSGAP
jgi:tetratricopeptide (TPR) repeat protein